jgi:hypothetical protein
MVAINEKSMPVSQANRCRTQRLVDNLYQGGINFYGCVNSSPVGNVDAEGLAHTGRGGKGKRGGMTANTGRRKRKK